MHFSHGLARRILRRRGVCLPAPCNVGGTGSSLDLAHFLSCSARTECPWWFRARHNTFPSLPTAPPGSPLRPRPVPPPRRRKLPRRQYRTEHTTIVAASIPAWLDRLIPPGFDCMAEAPSRSQCIVGRRLRYPIPNQRNPPPRPCPVQTLPPGHRPVAARHCHLHMSLVRTRLPMPSMCPEAH
jgi:hypothetical protein